MSAAVFSRRILVVDDNKSIHEDFRQFLRSAREDRASLLDCQQGILASAPASNPKFDIQSAYQGQEGVQLVCQARCNGQPFCIALVNVQMPSGIFCPALLVLRPGR